MSAKPIVIVLMAMGASACSASTPTELDARSALERHIREQQSVHVIVESLSKTNGQSQVAGGIKGYVLWFSAAVIYPEGLRPDCVGAERSFRGWDCLNVIANPFTKPRAKGFREVVDGRVGFTGTENGWLATAVYLESSRSLPTADLTASKLSPIDGTYSDETMTDLCEFKSRSAVT